MATFWAKTKDEVSKLFGQDRCNNEALRALFKDAAHGNHFHTRAYYDPKASVSNMRWWEAHNIAGEGWKILRVNRHALTRENDIFDSKEEVTDKYGLTFFEAVEQLIAYEITAPAEGLAEVLAPPADAALNDTHVIAFAEKEGIVFDKTTNVPHPTTQDGYIVCTGLFNAQAAEQARAAAQSRLLAQKLSLSRIAASVPSAYGAQVYFSAHPSLNEMGALLREALGFISGAEGSYWCYPAKASGFDSSKSYDEYLFKKNYFEESRKKYIAHLDTLFQNPALSTLSGDIKGEFIRAFDMVGLMMYASYASQASDPHLAEGAVGQSKGSFLKGTSYHLFDAKMLPVARKKVAALMKELNMGNGDENSPLINEIVVSARKPGKAEKVGEVLQWFDKVKGDLDAFIAQVTLGGAAPEVFDPKAPPKKKDRYSGISYS